MAGSLIERTQNFKDRCVRPARRQVAGFLVRRLVPREGADPTGGPNASGWAELAYVLTPEGPRWVEVAPERAETLLDAEQLNPMFNLGYRSSGVGRRLHAGVLPVGKREAFLAAPVDRLGVDSEDTTLDPRVVRLRSDVVGPWSALIEQARFASAQAKAYRNAATRPPLYSVLEDDLGVSPPATDTSASATQLRETLQTGTWYVAYGLALFLSEHLRPVYEALDPRLPTPTLEPAQQAVVTWLDATQPAASGNTVATFGALVRAIAATIDFEDPARTPLERVDVPFSSTAPHPDWPTARFLLANPATEDVPAGTFDAEDARLESLVVVVVAAMAPLDEDAVRLGPVLPTRLDGEEAWFQVRCVFSAPQCHPFQPAVVSAPTEAFTMAPFFDPDAPARPVR
ncbi:MAG: hypothetical protein KC621_09915, partial [Myxococcales bacterium]|nr:hypothetical protein [Myxococcales bacterium]